MSRQLRQAAAILAGPEAASAEALLVIEQAFRSRGWTVIRCAGPQASLQAWLDANDGALPAGFLAKIVRRPDTILVIPPPPKRS